MGFALITKNLSVEISYGCKLRRQEKMIQNNAK